MAWVGLAVGLWLAVGIILILRRHPVDQELARVVVTFPGSLRLSSDGRGTYATGHVENKSQVPVDVIFRFQGKDALGRVVAHVDSEPYRDLPPGSSTRIGATFDMIPLQGVEIEIVELSRSPD